MEAISKYDFREPSLPIGDEKREKDRKRKQKHQLSQRNGIFIAHVYESPIDRLTMRASNKICYMSQKLF